MVTSKGRMEEQPAHRPTQNSGASRTVRRGLPMPGSLLLVLAAAVSSTTLSSSAAFTASQSACMSSFRLQQMTPFTGCPLSMLPRRTPGRGHNKGPKALFGWLKKKKGNDEDEDSDGRKNEKLRWHSAVTQEKGLGGTEEERAQAARMRRAALVAQDPTYQTKRLGMSMNDNADARNMASPSPSPEQRSPSPDVEQTEAAQAQQEMERKKPGSKEAWYTSDTYSKLKNKLNDKKEEALLSSNGGWGELMQEETPEMKAEREARMKKLQEDAARTLGERAKYFNSDGTKKAIGTSTVGTQKIGSRTTGTQGLVSQQVPKTSKTTKLSPASGQRGYQGVEETSVYKRSFKEAADKKLAKILGVDPSQITRSQEITTRASSPVYVSRPNQKQSWGEGRGRDDPPPYRPPITPSQSPPSEPLNNASPYTSPSESARESSPQAADRAGSGTADSEEALENEHEGPSPDAAPSSWSSSTLSPFAAFFPSRSRKELSQQLDRQDVPRLGKPRGTQQEPQDVGALHLDVNVDNLPVIGEKEDDILGENRQWKVIARSGLLVHAGPSDAARPIARLKWMQAVDVDRESLPWVKIADMDGWVKVSGGVRGREIFMVRQGKTLGFDGEEMEKKWGKPAG